MSLPFITRLAPGLESHRRRVRAYMASRSAGPPIRCTPPGTQSHHYAAFTDLPAELRNRIYDLIVPPRNQHVTICAEKDARDVPYALSRTCRLVRRETAPYFLSGEGATLILALYTPDDVAACRDWISFVPAYSLGEVRTVKVKYSHCPPPSSSRADGPDGACRRACGAAHTLQLDDEDVLKFSGHLSERCSNRKAYKTGTALVQAAVERLPVEVEGSRAGGRKMTSACLEEVIGILGRGGRGAE